MKLTDRKWKPFYIGKIFDKIVPGKAKGRNHLKHDDMAFPISGRQTATTVSLTL
ncbi:MAG: hypothetical protein ACI4Q3_10220 [Kiritimatiellia bacterium]